MPALPIRLAVLAVLFAGWMPHAHAVEEIARPEPTESGRAYADMAADERIQANVLFPLELDPAQLAGPDTTVEIRRPEPQSSDRERWTWAAAITVILLIIAAVAIRYGGLGSIGFRRIGDRARDPDEERAVIEAEGGLAGFLDRLRAMRDRPAALLLLIQGALERAGQMTGARVLRSQTAREVLRRLPPDWPYRDALGRIVRVEEVVQFGGRELSEPVFEECLVLAEPLFDGTRR